MSPVSSVAALGQNNGLGKGKKKKKTKWNLHYMSCTLNIHIEKFYGPRAKLLERDLLNGEKRGKGGRVYMHWLLSNVMHFHKNLLWRLIIFQRYI